MERQEAIKNLTEKMVKDTEALLVSYAKKNLLELITTYQHDDCFLGSESRKSR